MIRFLQGSAALLAFAALAAYLNEGIWRLFLVAVLTGAQWHERVLGGIGLSLPLTLLGVGLLLAWRAYSGRPGVIGPVAAGVGHALALFAPLLATALR